MDTPTKRIFYGYAEKTENGWQCFHKPKAGQHIYWAVVINFFTDKPIEVELLSPSKENETEIVWQGPPLQPGQELEKVFGSLTQLHPDNSNKNAQQARLKNLHDLFKLSPTPYVIIEEERLSLGPHILLEVAFEKDQPYPRANNKKEDITKENTLN